ncbi:MAG TPA: hypothetical protein VL021_03040 [Brumimicrobium sp.]|nr:hypothetical protein [Brumimicrobium sp.]
MKRILKIAFFIFLFIGTVFILISANISTSKQVLTKPVIDLTVQDGISLLTETELLDELRVKQLIKEGMSKADVNLSEIENYVRNMNEVLTADVYMDLDTNWHIDVVTRRPVARVVTRGNKDFYIDNEFNLMKLSPYSKPRVLVFTGLESLLGTGFEYSKIINNDSLKTNLKLDQIYRISNYVCNDAFYDAQIVQVHYTKNDGFVLIPRVGDNKIIFGSANSDEMVSNKFEKLTTFYDEVIPYEGWDKYESINLKFKGQIVAKKKN